MKPLDPFVCPLDGISLVEAGAGTGKTYTITSLYVRAILEKGLLPSSVLVITFTEAATSELKTRIRSRLMDTLEAFQAGESSDPFIHSLINKWGHTHKDHLKKCIQSFDEASIFTIHGFCQRLLKTHSFAFGVSSDFRVLPDPSEVLQESIDAVWKDWLKKSVNEERYRIQIQLLTEYQYTPEKARNMLAAIIEQRSMHIVPEIPHIHVERMAADIEQALDRLRTSLEKEKETILTCVESGALKRNIYNVSAVAKVKAAIQAIEEKKIGFILQDKLELLGSAMCNAVKKGEVIPEFSTTARVDEVVQLYQSVPQVTYQLRLAWTEQAKEIFERSKATSNVLTYSDLLFRTNLGITAPENTPLLSDTIAEAYPFALVDEFQDTDPLQYGIINRLYSGRQGTGLFMIGDPKQAIYSFRGADIQAYLAARSDAPEQQRYTLNANYRTNEHLLDAVNHIFSIHPNPFFIPEIEYRPALHPRNPSKMDVMLTCNQATVTPMEWIHPSDPLYSKGEGERWCAETTAERIVQLCNDSYRLNEARVSPGHVAVLVRKHAQAELVREALNSRGVNAVIRGKDSVFDTGEAHFLFTILYAIAHPSDVQALRLALVLPWFGYTQHSFEELVNTESRWAKVTGYALQAYTTWMENGIHSAIQYLREVFQLSSHIVERAHSERIITNLDHLIEQLHQAEHEKLLGPDALLHWFQRKRNGELITSDDEVIRLESDRQGVRILTQHYSKGLEFPIVFCPFLWEPFQKPRSNESIRFHADGGFCVDYLRIHDQRADFEYLSMRDDLSESIRLAYVALTRAESACFVLTPTTELSGPSALGVLLNGSQSMHDMLKEPGSKSSIPLDLSNLDTNTHIRIRSEELPTVSKLNRSIDVSDQAFTPRTFTRKPTAVRPGMHSYSSITRSKNDFSDRSLSLIETNPETEEAEPSRFTFPKGAATGNVLHELLDEIPFGDYHRLRIAVPEKLRTYVIEEKWGNILQQWVIDTWRHSLGAGLPALIDLEKNDTVKEMEFYFPITELEIDELSALLGHQRMGDRGRVNGFMKGFIDLIFCHKGKYYIADYKTNHLGDGQEDYSADALNQAMQHHHFDVQYHVYTVALHRYLNKRIPGQG
ncbi:MAG: exodeoxyribonuclease V subunit beta [Bacteroidota bacterium]